MSILWLVSYPKSGSTWARAVLTNYLEDGDAPASIEALIAPCWGSERGYFDEGLGVESSDLTAEEILRCRPQFQELLAEELPHPTVARAHDAYIRNADGAPVFSRRAAAGAVYLVRNPLDVAVSYAHHLRHGVIDRAVAYMNDAASAEWASELRIHALLPQFLLTWSAHVTSWLEQEEIPVHVSRYEDRLADPVAEFGAIVRFAGFEWDEARLARAIEYASFDRLHAEEAEHGYSGVPRDNATPFFRSGKAGGWRTALDAHQVRRLVDAHGPVMARFGYLADAEAFLAEHGPVGWSGGA